MGKVTVSIQVQVLRGPSEIPTIALASEGCDPPDNLAAVVAATRTGLAREVRPLRFGVGEALRVVGFEGCPEPGLVAMTTGVWVAQSLSQPLVTNVDGKNVFVGMPAWIDRAKRMDTGRPLPGDLWPLVGIRTVLVPASRRAEQIMGRPPRSGMIIVDASDRPVIDAAVGWICGYVAPKRAIGYRLPDGQIICTTVDYPVAAA